MAFNINEIGSIVNKYRGIQNPSHFFVRITPPSFLVNNQYNKNIEFLCHSFNAPLLELSTTPMNPLGYGHKEHRPNDVNYSPLSMGLFLDAKGEGMQFFSTWLGNIVNFDIDSQKLSDSTNLSYYRFAYPEEYEGIVELYILDKSGNQFLKFKYNRAFPYVMDNLHFAWDRSNELSNIVLNFSYTQWTSEIQDAEAVSGENLLPYNKLNNNLSQNSFNSRIILNQV